MSTREQGVRRIAAVTGGLVAASVAGPLAVAAAAHAADSAAADDHEGTVSSPSNGSAGGPSGDDGGSGDDLSGVEPGTGGFSQPGQQPVLPGGGFGSGHAQTGGS